MGFDVSFHPVDVQFAHNRLFPYIMGEGSLDDERSLGVRLAKIKWRANEWALGTLATDNKISDQQRKFLNEDERPWPDTGIPGFNSDLHVWGRPFFVDGDSPAEISAAIDEFLACDVDDVDRLARQTIEKLDARRAQFDPGLPAEAVDLVRKLPPLVDQVQRNTDKEAPSEQDLEKELFFEIDFLREAWQAHGKGQESIQTPDGEDAPIIELLCHSLPLACLTFMAHFQPGWMARGYVWPTNLFSQANADFERLDQAIELFSPLIEKVPEIGEELDPSICENYMVGGYTNVADVPALLDHFNAHREAINEWARNDDWGDQGAEPDLQKIHEAISDAQHRGFGFAEAAEVYSGIMGIMN